MRDSRRIQERAEVRLDRTQVIWLSLGSVVALGLVFALGVVVGRRAEKLEPPAAPVADPLAQLEAQNKLHDELTFYSKLTAAPTPAAPSSEATARAAPVVKPAREEEPTPTAALPAPAPGTTATNADDPVSRALAAGPARAGQYTVQVSSFQTEEEASAYAAALRRKGYAPYVVSAHITGKGTWHRVRLGAFTDEEQANDAKHRLAGADIPAWVLRAE